jgi:hypothetical protein
MRGIAHETLRKRRQYRYGYNDAAAASLAEGSIVFPVHVAQTRGVKCALAIARLNSVTFSNPSEKITHRGAHRSLSARVISPLARIIVASFRVAFIVLRVHRLRQYRRANEPIFGMLKRDTHHVELRCCFQPRSFHSRTISAILFSLHIDPSLKQGYS